LRLWWQIAKVACGAAHTCVLRAAGSVECYGYNGGNETNVPAGILFSDIAAGTRHNCGLTKGEHLQSLQIVARFPCSSDALFMS
jgi:hypothetical protein